MAREVCVWISLDPVGGKIDFYPSDIAYKIEKQYNFHTQSWFGGKDLPCVLGSDFFNASIHFYSNPDQNYYQTTRGTPSFTKLDCTFKQPGYRCVKRIVLTPHSTHVEIFGQRINNEWRITNNHTDSEKTFNVKIPTDVIIYQ
jgi:hypothetical protein|tara:strand:- start:1068 stop:1496 length:429 start_codon:yes stop_codon:yes gene_type:complete